MTEKFDTAYLCGCLLGGSGSGSSGGLLGGGSSLLGGGSGTVGRRSVLLAGSALRRRWERHTQVVSIRSGWESLDMDAGRTFLTSLTFPPEPLGWSKTPTSTPRAMALLTWFKLAADDMSSLYLSAKNLVDRWELQCDQYRRDRSPRRRDDLLLDGGTRDTLTGIGRARDAFLVERWK